MRICPILSWMIIWWFGPTNSFEKFSRPVLKVCWLNEKKIRVGGNLRHHGTLWCDVTVKTKGKKYIYPRKIDGLEQSHYLNQRWNYNDIIMGAMASQITSLTIVYSTVLFRPRSKKISKLRITGLCEGNSPMTGEFPAQRASNAENVSIWWRHHVYF